MGFRFFGACLWSFLLLMALESTQALASFRERSFQTVVPAEPLLTQAFEKSPRVLPAGVSELVWPDDAPAAERANSSPWLIANRAKITLLKPRVLIINFRNGLSDKQVQERAESLANVLEESSRFQGFRSQAPAMVQYQIYQVANLADIGAPEMNSVAFPRYTDSDGNPSFKYSELFSGYFTARLGIKDATGKIMGLEQALEEGVIHEVWFIAAQTATDVPYEVIELKTRYKNSSTKLLSWGKPQFDRYAGNGGPPPSDDVPWFGVSYRILFINADRGLGCAMHSLGHAFESFMNRGVIPDQRANFRRFGAFDLKFDSPIETSFYDIEGAQEKFISYPTPSSVRVATKGGVVTKDPFDAVCGNVHFQPNARYNYDQENTQTVLTSCLNFGVSADKLPYTGSHIAKYESLVDEDCGGHHQVWWRQNMPAFGHPLGNWWPFLFY